MNRLISIGMQDSTAFRYQRHCHEYWEITYYYEGDGVNVSGGVEYPFGSNTILCEPPGMEHEDISPNGYRNIFCLVDDLKLPAHRALAVQDTACRDFLTILQKLYGEHHSQKRPRVANALMLVLVEYLQEFTSAEARPGNLYVEQMKEKIVANLSNPSFCVTDEMKKIPVSLNHFRLLFERETGMSPQKYLQHIRMGHAQSLLKGSSSPIRDICFLCGYSDPYYFSRAFKKHTGVAPSRFQEQQERE